MKLCVVLSLCLAVAFTYPRDEVCTSENCLRENGCVCISTDSPLALEETPQFVILSFDDVVREDIYQQYYEGILFDRVNPDGNPISATFFVPHEYTNYTRVNDLYNRGFEIAVGSITRNALASYWADADVETLIQEFEGQRTIISTFANIPIEDVIGARTPHLQIAGNRTFEALTTSGLLYDNSWPALTLRKLYPYTLDHRSDQQCLVGDCPDEYFPGMFVHPIINFKSQSGIECNSLFGCQVMGTVDEIFGWFVEQFENVHLDKKSPQTWNLNSVWFATTPNALEAYLRFLDYLGGLDDVFLVSHEVVRDWMLDPIPLSNFTAPAKLRQQSCFKSDCYLPFLDNQTRPLGSCIDCPPVYPWLGNPLGLA